MHIRKEYIERPFTKSVAFMFVSYWAALVAWQNISEVALRGAEDMIIKILLLVYFVCFFLLRVKILHTKIIPIWLLGISLLITFLSSEQLTLSTLISYVYPVLCTSMVFGVGDRYVISRKQLLSFCNAVIIITLYAAVYAIVFKWDRFSGALSLRSAYGSELTSFFTSSHEYGMYLAAAIISCLLCIKLYTDLSASQKSFYLAAMGIFGINLILTYSRTSIYALAIFILIFAFFDNSSLKTWAVILMLALAVVILCSPVLSSYIFNIVMKGNEAGGRSSLYSAAIEYFNNGTIFEKIFGHGITEVRQYFEDSLRHGSVHNAYLQVLLYYGIIGAGSLILYVLSQCFASLKLMRKNRFMGTICIGLNLAAAAMMFTNTAIIFTSPTDSYFMTIFMFIVPKYVRNAINYGAFDRNIMHKGV